MRQLGGLMVHICGGVAVQQKNSALLIIAVHMPSPGGIAVHAVQHRCGIGVDLLQRTQLPAQVGFDQRRGILVIVREFDPAHRFAQLFSPLAQQLHLGAFAAAVQPFDDDELALHATLPPLADIFCGPVLLFRRSSCPRDKVR